MQDIIRAIESIDLPAPSRGATASGSPATFGDGPQAVVVAAQMAEFTARVPQPLRPAVSQGLLLGQLAADKATLGRPDPWAWYTAYGAVMTRLGWLPTAAEISEQAIDGRNAELHKAILPVIAAALGPAAAAGSILLAVLRGLQDMDTDTPWLTLFEQRSRSATAAKFGLSYVDAGADGGVALKTMFFGLQARQVLTQVLFFKFTSADATVKSATSEAVLGADILRDTEAALRDKVAPFITDNIKNLDI